ncbi:MFS transporter [Paenibacillus sp. FSL P4-0184]|uniref:MFS transporter n=1 Tax=Paenibacillus sp. FSL P4-0184 TaxID=2921632 RepID=UPI0030F74910
MNENQMPWRERISYGLKDTASNLIFQITTLYLMYFYTDVFGLNPGAVAVVFLVARVIDAIVEPFIGVMIDRTQTKWGEMQTLFSLACCSFQFDCSSYDFDVGFW